MAALSADVQLAILYGLALLATWLFFGYLGTVVLLAAVVPWALRSTAVDRKMHLVGWLKAPSTLLVKYALADKADAMRSGILNGFKGFAEKRNIFWRRERATLEARGMEVWNGELEAVRNESLEIPAYYEAHGVSTLHSYNEGNCNWARAS